MEGATIGEIREAFGQEMIAAAARLKEHFGLPTQEAMVAIYAAASCFEEVGRKDAGWDNDTVRSLRETGAECGSNLYSELQKKAAAAAGEEEPQKLGDGQKLGIVGPEDGTGVLDASGNEVKPAPLVLEGQEVVVHVIGECVMTAKFPGGLPVNQLDSVSLLAGALEFLRQQPDVDITPGKYDEREAHARTEIRRAVAQSDGESVRIGPAIFGPEGPATQVEEEPAGPALVGLDGKKLK